MEYKNGHQVQDVFILKAMKWNVVNITFLIELFDGKARMLAGKGHVCYISLLYTSHSPHIILASPNSNKLHDTGMHHTVHTSYISHTSHAMCHISHTLHYPFIIMAWSFANQSYGASMHHIPHASHCSSITLTIPCITLLTSHISMHTVPCASQWHDLLQINHESPLCNSYTNWYWLCDVTTWGENIAPNLFYFQTFLKSQETFSSNSLL